MSISGSTSVKNKQRILDEIRRTATANGGTPLGRERFERETGIKQSDWFGRYWARWGDAVREAGFEANAWQVAFSDDDVLRKLAALIRQRGHYPTNGELRMHERTDPEFPNHGVFARLGSKQQLVRKVLAYCEANPGNDDVAKICAPLIRAEPTGIVTEDVFEVGYVYLALMKVGREKRYKIGKANLVDQRTRQVAVNLPEDLELIHAISTDDAYGIEGYWHKRFAEKRRGGEWFELTAEDVRVFKRRKFM
jgi:hypothetical protein